MAWLRLQAPRLHALARATPVVAALLAVPGPGLAQEAVVRVEENFRAEPNGEILGRLDPGAPLLVEDREGGWTRVTARGFVYIPSLQVWPDPTLDLIVSAPDGENLRAEPSGRVIGRFEDGTLLEEVERIPGWIEVRRTGWVWAESIDLREPPLAAADAGPSASPAPPADDAPIPDIETNPAGSPGSGVEAPSAPTPALVSGASAGTAILMAPDGDTLARTVRGSDLRVLAREGNWARVQLEGWVWAPGASGPPAPPGDGDAFVEVEVETLVQDPDLYLGRLVVLELQFISLEEAEEVRTDFYQGEPFLLTRSNESERRFVYVAVPPERVAEVRDLTPLQEIRVTARLRSGAAALTGSPIVDLVELEARP